MTVRAVFMGTPEFAVLTLEALVSQGWDVLVVTQPDRKVGRKRVLTPPPVKVAAEKLGLSVIQPTKIREPEIVRQLVDFQADIFVTAAFGQLLPQSVLDIPRVGAINVHASLLPRWRGAAPIHRAIMAGDKETGVTLMEMVKALDAGPILDEKSIPIEETDTVATLHDKLASLGAQMAIDVLPRYLAGQITVREQPDEGVTYAAKIERADEFIKWAQPVEVIDRHVRGMNPWPGAATIVGEDTMKIWSVKPMNLRPSLPAGTVIKLDDEIVVHCLDSCIQLDTVQPAGRKRMSARAWFSGLHVDSLQLEDGQTI